MEGFQRIISIIAIVILIICLVIIGITLSRSNKTQVWPPMVGDCPDYWIDASGNGAKCVNSKDLGTCKANLGADGHSTMDFTVAPYVGSNGLCAKYTWANACGLTWDGITYGNNGNPCDTTKDEATSK